VLLALRFGRRAVLAAALVGAAGSIATRLVLWHAGIVDERVRFGSDTSAAGLLLGCALAAYLCGRPTGRNRPALAAALVAVIAAQAALSSSPFHYAITATLAATLLTPVAIWLVVREGPAGVLGARALRFVGSRSYAYYLWHVPLNLLAMLAMDWRRTLVGGVMVLILTALFGEISWRLVERPVLRRSLPQRMVTTGAPVNASDTWR